MPVYQLDIEKRFSSEFWTNRYFLNGTSLVEAIGVAPAFVAAERAFHPSSVEFVKYRLSTVAEGDNEFYTEPLGGTGLVALSDFLPLWNVVRVTFGIVGRRPHYKLYRGILGEPNTLNGIIAPTTLEEIQTALENISDVNTTGTGVTLGPGIPDSRIRMRQLRRGTRKRKTPVLPPA